MPPKAHRNERLASNAACTHGHTERIGAQEGPKQETSAREWLARERCRAKELIYYGGVEVACSLVPSEATPAHESSGRGWRASREFGERALT